MPQPEPPPDGKPDSRQPEAQTGARPDPPRRRRRWRRRLLGGAAVLAVIAVVAGGVAYRSGLLPALFGPVDRPTPSPVTAPAQVLPPAGLALPAARAVAPVAAPVAGRAVSAAAVRRAVASLVGARKLGRHVVVRVAQLSDGRVVYRHGTGAVTPASTMKMLTTVAALQALGPAHRFTTSVVAARHSRRIVLVGGGDPLLARSPAPGSYPARADLTTLARSTARALRAAGRRTVRLGYDTSLFSGPAVNPRWEPSYIPDEVVSAISPLWVDEGRERAGFAARSRSSPLAAATAFARALGRQHVTVTGAPTRAVAPPRSSGGHEVARVQGAPLAGVVQHVLEVSDNEGAEVLARQVAVARGEPASSVGASRAVRAVLRTIGVSTAGDRIYDGSGLSRQDRLRPETLLAVVEAASSPERPRLRAAVANLPVAGFTGSLASRFDRGDPAGLGTVRAKTGTLTGVHGLTGTATSRDGAVMVFVAVADRVKPVNTLDARVLVDRVAAALGGCECTRRPQATP